MRKNGISRLVKGLVWAAVVTVGLLGAKTAGADATIGLSFLRRGTLTKETAIVYSEANRSSEELVRMAAGEICEIIGSTEKYYHVRFEQQAGYVLKNSLAVDTV